MRGRLSVWFLLRGLAEAPGSSPGLGAQGLDITDIRLRLVETGRSAKLKAFVSITLEGAFVVHDIKVIEGQRGLFVAMPSRRNSAGDFKDIAHPIDPATREEFTEKILAEYWRVVEESSPSA